jgi:hypothetical protein
MLLQTFIQLHILLAATPALAGWVVFVPTAQPLPAHVLYLVSQSTARPGPASSDGHQVVVLRVLPAPMTARHRFITSQPISVVSVILPPSSVAEVLPQNDLTYPHGPRAP